MIKLARITKNCGIKLYFEVHVWMRILKYTMFRDTWVCDSYLNTPDLEQEQKNILLFCCGSHSLHTLTRHYIMIRARYCLLVMMPVSGWITLGSKWTIVHRIDILRAGKWASLWIPAGAALWWLCDWVKTKERQRTTDRVTGSQGSLMHMGNRIIWSVSEQKLSNNCSGMVPRAWEWVWGVDLASGEFLTSYTSWAWNALDT